MGRARRLGTSAGTGAGTRNPGRQWRGGIGAAEAKAVAVERGMGEVEAKAVARAVWRAEGEAGQEREPVWAWQQRGVGSSRGFVWLQGMCQGPPLERWRRQQILCSVCCRRAGGGIVGAAAGSGGAGWATLTVLRAA